MIHLLSSSVWSKGIIVRNSPRAFSRDEGDRHAPGDGIQLKDEEKDREDKAEQKGDTTVHLDWRDWVALTIASMETILLPAIVLVVVMIVLAILFGRLP